MINFFYIRKMHSILSSQFCGKQPWIPLNVFQYVCFGAFNINFYITILLPIIVYICKKNFSISQVKVGYLMCSLLLRAIKYNTSAQNCYFTIKSFSLTNKFPTICRTAIYMYICIYNNIHYKIIGYIKEQKNTNEPISYQNIVTVAIKLKHIWWLN